ncbi:MAG: hypothetical protein ACRENG_19205 [bacterium]
MHQQITILFPEIAAGDFVAVFEYGCSRAKSHIFPPRFYPIIMPLMFFKGLRLLGKMIAKENCPLV